MDSEAADRAPQPADAPKSGAERVRKHRKRRQQLDMQVAYGIAKLVTGQGAGDQAKAILLLLEKAASGRTVPDDMRSVLDEAIDKLKSRSRY
jgi:hypothetical protein